MAGRTKAMRDRTQAIWPHRDRQFRCRRSRLHRSGDGPGMARSGRAALGVAIRESHIMTDKNQRIPNDRELGMNRAIPRRDFLNGAAMAIGSSLVPHSVLCGMATPDESQNKPN